MNKIYMTTLQLHRTGPLEMVSKHYNNILFFSTSTTSSQAPSPRVPLRGGGSAPFALCLPSLVVTEWGSGPLHWAYHRSTCCKGTHPYAHMHHKLDTS